MLCPSPLQYTVDPMLLPSRNLGKNAMERFRGLLSDMILLTQCYPIVCLMGYYVASVAAFLCLLPDIVLLTKMLCSSPRQYNVDPMLLPSGNPRKNAMERVRSYRFRICSLLSQLECSGSVFTACVIVSYYIVPVLFLLAFWCPCMTINVII